MAPGRLLSLFMSDDSLVPPAPAPEGPPPPPAAESASPNAETPAPVLETHVTPAPEPPPLAATPAPPAPPPPPVRHAFLFHGDEREYFRLWIVNTLLTLLTFGLFAAWAKVRKRRYLRGNTELMGHRFDYRANPWRLLIGNLIVVVLFAAYGLFGQVYPVVRIIAFAIGVILLPWIVVRSLAFNAHNTAYRGMRFYFHQGYLGAAALYFAQFFLVLITLGIYYPAWARDQRAFIITNHRLGDALFRFDATRGRFYAAYFSAGALVSIVIFIGGVYLATRTVAHPGKIPGFLEMLPFFACYGLALYVAKHLVYAMLFNHVWNHTRLDDHRFVAELKTGAWLQLQLVNLAAIVGTVGLLYPWAQIRSVRYALAHLQFQPAGPLEKTERLGRDEGNALGESAGELFGMDFGL